MKTIKFLAKLLSDDPTPRCGYKWFSLKENHPFTSACAKHDAAFSDKKASRNLADTQLLKDMLEAAKEKKSIKLRVEAYLLYGIARTLGKILW